ncbi:MAG: FAD-dependent oxidoreductase [Traorella sp.]
MSKHKNLFSPITIGKVTLKNRVVMGAMDTDFANCDGTVSRQMMAHYVERARGGVGLIVVEAAAVGKGIISPRQARIDSLNVVPSWKDMVDTVHSFGTKILCQLHHGGFKAIPVLAGGVESVSPSGSGYEGDMWPYSREITRDEIQEVINQHIQSAMIAYSTGVDGVEINAIGGYLLNQFLNPAINRRTDEYGGSIENRGRILIEIIKGIKAICPLGSILSVRFPVRDYSPGGLELEDGLKLAKMCEEAGANLINAAIGFYTDETATFNTESQWQEEGARLYLAEKLKAVLETAKVGAVGKLRTPSFCDQAIADGKTDLIVIGRQMLGDPHWARKAELGLDNEIRPCLNCNEGCYYYHFYQHAGARCAVNPYTGYEDLYQEHNVAMAGVKKNVVVIGGGIAGMQTAIIAKKRGHNVTLIEKTDKLGGQMILAAKPSYKNEVQKVCDWFAEETTRQNVSMKLNTTITFDEIKQMNTDVVVFATGSIDTTPPIKGAEISEYATSVLAGESEIPENKNLVVIGGGVVGAEFAHLMLSKGNKVTILEMLDEICKGHEPMHKNLLTKELTKMADIKTSVRVTEVMEYGVKYIDANGMEYSLACDKVYMAAGRRSVTSELEEKLVEDGITIRKVGDCSTVGNFRTATRSAMDVAYSI